MYLTAMAAVAEAATAVVVVDTKVGEEVATVEVVAASAAEVATRCLLSAQA